MKKRLFGAALAAVISVSPAIAFAACSPRDEVLKIFNWGDYIDEELIGEFETWYAEETGKTVSVEYSTFETNEDMLMRVETLKTDYDLVCPSDYMAERMIKSGLVRKVDKSVFDFSADGVLYDGLLDMIKPFDPTSEYFVPYVWGTFGIMYDTERIPAGSEEMKSWSAMWSNKYSKHILMKDSVRDAYSVARIYTNTQKLSELSDGFTNYGAEYRAEIDSYFSEISASSVRSARDALVEQKGKLYKYEVDDGKLDMLSGTTQGWLGLFWSCDSGLIMQEDNGDHFYYEVPKEGSNVWVDGWMIPKYAQNVTAANYFLKFINLYDDDHDYAMRNFDYMGSSMSMKSVMTDGKADLEYMMYNELTDEEKAEMDADDIEYAEMMYSRPDWFKSMYIDMMFPSQAELDRCGIMRDFGKKWSTELDSMWIDVKTM